MLKSEYPYSLFSTPTLGPLLVIFYYFAVNILVYVLFRAAGDIHSHTLTQLARPDREVVGICLYVLGRLVLFGTALDTSIPVKTRVFTICYQDLLGVFAIWVSIISKNDWYLFIATMVTGLNQATLLFAGKLVRMGINLDNLREEIRRDWAAWKAEANAKTE